ncbi:uncharacterized protein At4g04775-like [Brassica rapa]|uniref:uncharacterized protein At4g04775-like n=1 Tax=Brassica campestris TaxID=3711 RepID=UPI00142E81A2|nr:uncharacterized protein At4g04775-like [Brassica rapa]
MSNESGNSSGTSAGRARGRVVGVPKRCWCGELVVSLMSKSTANPYRKYYRCAFAAEKRLSNDNHTYKWVDEALVDEAEALKIQLGRLEQTIVHERAEEERKRFAEFEMKLETEVFNRMEDAITQAKWENKKVMGIVVLGCLSMVVVSKLI